MLQQFAWFLHMLCALCIIILVLLQHGKGAEMGASLGSGGASQTIFGSQGSGSFLTKITTIFALIFAITSISLSFFINQSNEKISKILLEQHKVKQQSLLEQKNSNSESLKNIERTKSNNPDNAKNTKEIPE